MMWGISLIHAISLARCEVISRIAVNINTAVTLHNAGCTGTAEDNTSGRIRREQLFRDNKDCLAHDDDRFRLSGAVLLDLYAELGPAIDRPSSQKCATPVQIYVGYNHSGVSGSRLLAAGIGQHVCLT